MTPLLALLALAAPSAEPLPSPSLDEVRAHPQAFARKRVRLHGQVDACYGPSCSLCPEQATPADPQRNRCLRLGFDRFADGRDASWGADLRPMFRYADVVLTATFDPSCLSGLCTDNATVLRDARVERVTRRRGSDEGLDVERDPLRDPPAAAAAALVERARRAGNPIRGYRAFAASSDPAMATYGIVCRSALAADEPVRWPATFSAAILARGTEDHYRCWTAKKVDGDWVIQLD